MRIEELAAQTALQPVPLKPAQGGEKDFGQLLMDALKEVNKTQLEAGELRDAFARGEPVELHDVMIALEKSGIALQLAVQVRNKLLEAYQEISRIPV
jgi:flagellar hook-basal body complex protein FliE